MKFIQLKKLLKLGRSNWLSCHAEGISGGGGKGIRKVERRRPSPSFLNLALARKLLWPLKWSYVPGTRHLPSFVILRFKPWLTNLGVFG